MVDFNQKLEKTEKKIRALLMKDIQTFDCSDSEKVGYRLSVLDKLFVEYLSSMIIISGLDHQDKENILREHFTSVRERINERWQSPKKQ